jgi:hypothetical protein
MTTSTAASAYVDFIKASGSIAGHEIVHLVHPRPISWDDLMSIIARELDLPLIPFEDWFKALHVHVLKDETNDLKLLMKKFPLIRIMLYPEPFLMNGSKTRYVDCTAVPLLRMDNAFKCSRRCKM